MGTPENTAHIVDALRAAFAPGADAVTKEGAAGILRALLATLEATPGAPLLPSTSGSPGTPAAQPDLLGALVEKFRAYLPADAALTIPRLNIPLVTVPKP